MKAVYFVEEEWPDLIASTGFAVLRPVESVHPKLLAYLLQSSSFIEPVILNSLGVAYPAISETRLGTLHVALPPDIGEQQDILTFIRDETASLDTAIRQAQNQITLIREYRDRLIADAVTGRLNVYTVAASLSEQADSPELVGPGDTDPDDDIEGDDFELEAAAA